MSMNDAPPQNPVAEAPLTEADITAHSEALSRAIDVVASVVVGQQQMVRRLVLGLITGGHVLLEGVPGLAKTLTVSTLAGALHAKYNRIQFTPDLLPADLVGTLIYNPADATFAPRLGPVFANIVLADEINRAPAKVQSALLEAMQEKSVSIGGDTHALPKPFLVLATQNPIEQEGTYPLPEAQVDRFMLKLRVGYPTKDDERAIVDRMASTTPPTDVEPVVTLDEITKVRGLVNRVVVDPRLRDYIIDLVHVTREPGDTAIKTPAGETTPLTRLVEFGASPRASIALALAARAEAFLSGRPFVTPSDIKAVALDVMRHRVITTYEAEAEGVDPDDIVRAVLDTVAVP
ncbi:MAG: AAA family ATPase [Planctomycetota bacterium]